MNDPKDITTLALQIAAEIYKEEVRLAIAYAGITSQPDALIHAREHYKRAEAAHFLVGLLLDTAEAQRDELTAAPGAVDATPIHVLEGSSHLPAPDRDAALVLDTLKTFSEAPLGSGFEARIEDGSVRHVFTIDKDGNVEFKNVRVNLTADGSGKTNDVTLSFEDDAEDISESIRGPESKW